MALAATALHAYVGHEVRARKPAGEAGLASALFATFWYGLAANSCALAASGGLALVGAYDRALALTLLLLRLLAICGALFGLVYYLLFLYLGNPRILWPTAAAYGGLYVLLVYVVLARVPTGVAIAEWDVALTYALPLTPGLNAAIILLLPTPVIGAAIAYGSLLFRVHDPERRYRIALITTALVAWFGIVLLGMAAGNGRLATALPVLARLLGIAGPGLALLAYRPPAAVRARLRRAAQAPLPQ